MAIIGINALFLIPNKVGGTEYHLRSFVEGLQKFDKKNNYVLFCNQENFDTFTLTNPLWQKVLCSIQATSRLQRILYEQFRFPHLIEVYKCTMLHSYGYFGPLRLKNCKNIVTVHDANWRDHPEDVSFLSRQVLSLLIEKSLHQADLVITDSQFSQQRLFHFFPFLKKKLQVVWPWVSEEFHDIQYAPKQSEKYILSVSGMYPHKKMLYLLDLWQEYEKQEVSYQLVIVGKNGKNEKEIQERVKEIRNIEYFPKIAFSQLLALYKHASAFVFPSVYEGFGYPVYEACTVGIPTLVGRKDLYHPEMQQGLYELTFNRQKDVQIMIDLLQKKKSKRKNVAELHEEKSCRQLIQLYEKLA